MRYIIKAVLTVSIVSLMAACSAAPVQESKYSDPSKKYAAFIVQNSPNSAAAIDKAKFQMANDGYEPGPLEYYNAGTRDFDPIVKKVLVSKQVTCIYILGNVMDMTPIITSASKAGYKGDTRFLSVSMTTEAPQ